MGEHLDCFIGTGRLKSIEPVPPLFGQPDPMRAPADRQTQGYYPLEQSPMSGPAAGTGSIPSWLTIFSSALSDGAK